VGSTLCLTAELRAVAADKLARGVGCALAVLALCGATKTPAPPPACIAAELEEPGIASAQPESLVVAKTRANHPGRKSEPEGEERDGDVDEKLGGDHLGGRASEWSSAGRLRT
jgi:hypothetical protein